MKAKISAVLQNTLDINDSINILDGYKRGHIFNERNQKGITLITTFAKTYETISILNPYIVMSADATAERKTYTGACHCKKFEFEFQQSEIKEGTVCNCSICSQRGMIMTYVPASITSKCRFSRPIALFPRRQICPGRRF